MRALVATPEAPYPAEIREFDPPSASPDEVIVAVRAFSINRGETHLLSARPGWRPGQDISGTVVEAAADGSGPPVGARVAALVDEAGWAERVAVPVSRVGLLPENVSFIEGATLGVAGLTALRTLRVGGSLLGSRVLVTGAAGGVGRFAIQLARLGGAEVTAVVGSAARREGLAQLGAAHVIVEPEEPAGAFDIVMEGVSGPGLRRSVHALGPGGLLVLYGAASQQSAPISFFDFRGRPRARIEAFFIYETDQSTFGRDIAYLAALAGDGKIVAPVGYETRWEDIRTAIEALSERRVNGKAVLTID
jgi:NADPH:quinone reductase